jgi:two-component system NtrC family sensor kinase
MVYHFPVYLHFFFAYLEIQKHRWVIPACYGYAFVLMGFTQSPLFLESMKRHPFGLFPVGGPLYLFFGLISMVVMVYVVVVMIKAIRAEKRAVRKNKLKYMLAGVGLLGLLHEGNFLSMTGASLYPPGNLSFMALAIFGFGLFKHDLLDSGLLLRKGLVYSILISFLTCLYALIIISANHLLSGSGFSDSFYFPVVFFLFVAVLFGPVNHRIKTLVDRVFDRGKVEYQKTLKNVSRKIASVLDINLVVDQIIGSLQESMKIENIFLFLRTPPGNGYRKYASSTGEGAGAPDIFQNRSFLVSTLEKGGETIFMSKANLNGHQDQGLVSDLEALNAAMVIPFIFRDRLNGFLSLGEKTSGEGYTAEDVDLLETMALQGALAVENANAYGKIEALNRSLENKVEMRTAELQKALLEKEKTREQLIRSESLAAIGQLVAGTAHELNNPLAAAISILQSSIEDLKESAPDGGPVDENFLEDLEFARKELKRAADIVKSLLGLSRQTQTYTELVDMNAVIRDALQILLSQYKHLPVTIKEDYETGLPMVPGNFSSLGQVMLNVIQNAFQALKETGGEISLRTGYDEKENHVIVECSDDGPGIPEHLKLDIFKPFFTTKPVGQGTGLGLYICHEIVARHQGEIKLADNHGKGTKFMIRLPIKNAQPEIGEGLK